ncbi:MAG: PE family protein [Corynebacterium sp.]
MQGAAPVGSSASGGRPGGAGAPHMMGGAGMGAAGAGHKGKGAGHGRGAVSPFQSAGIGGGAKGSKGRSGLSGIQDYFRRQFLGEKPRTVKKVIR